MLDLTTMDLATADPGLNGFRSGFSKATYGHLVAFGTERFLGRCRASRSAIFRQRVPWISPRAVLGITTTDAVLKCFTGGFRDATCGNIVPYSNGA